MSREARAPSMNSTTPQNQQKQHAKRRTKRPGNPDPSAEVIAMSPRSLLATDRYVCEQCQKSFIREQNLKLHMRSHQPPSNGDADPLGERRAYKRAYICPEPSCIYNDPARALGDITGIKKHYGRKHGEKKWQCDRCLKRYAVELDWKAHLKVCNSHIHKCDCGMVFPRKNTYITHRSFCGVFTWKKTQPPAPVIAGGRILPTENSTAVNNGTTLPTLQDLPMSSTSIGHQPVQSQEESALAFLFNFDTLPDEPEGLARMCKSLMELLEMPDTSNANAYFPSSSSANDVVAPTPQPVPVSTPDPSLSVPPSIPRHGDSNMNGDNGCMINYQDQQASMGLGGMGQSSNSWGGDGLFGETSNFQGFGGSGSGFQQLEMDQFDDSLCFFDGLF